MTRGNDICDMCDTCHKCESHQMCYTVSRCNTLTQKVQKIRKKTKKICQLKNEIYVTHCDTIRHCDTFVTQKVFKIIGPSKDVPRHGRAPTCFYHICLLLFLLPHQAWGINDSVKTFVNVCITATAVQLFAELASLSWIVILSIHLCWLKAKVGGEKDRKYDIFCERAV
jgi:hypothetical protein